MLVIVEVLLLTTNCEVLNGSPVGSQAASAPAQVHVAITPDAATLGPSARQQFTANVSGTNNSAVNWTASAGSISSNGTFTAPAANEEAQIIITATSVADSNQKASCTVRIQRLAIATSSLASGVLNSAYSASLAAMGGSPPYKWGISNGSLPKGLQLQASTGMISGTSLQQGAFSFTAQVTDVASNTATQPVTLNIVATAATANNFDGPAELPRVYLKTTLADTPAPGPTVTVASGGDLQSALDNATCGETIALQAGSTFTGKFTLPQKACDDLHWIIIRTSAVDDSLPPEGTRMNPCYAGIASLPGRPSFACPSSKKVLATITYAGTGNGPIQFANGANHYRLMALEVTRVANNGRPVVGLISPALGAAAEKIVIDRLYIHGSATDETRRGVRLSGTVNFAVQDSYISEFHCAQGGTCVDSQAVSGGTGDLPMGPFKIDNNFLEAAGENIIFGGGAATQTPADIEIRHNHLFKPIIWMRGQRGFVSPAFIVKNHFELKNAQRVLFEGNILEGTWGGFSQHGHSVVITPKNQHNGREGDNVCPLCKVTDVTVRYVTISHVGGAFLIANALSGPNGGPASKGERYSIHDVIADDIDGAKYTGYGVFAQLSTIVTPLLQDVTINHVTAFAPHALFDVGAPEPVQMLGIAFTNSIVTSGDSGIASTGPFPNAPNCARFATPSTTITRCFSHSTFSHNAILDTPDRLPPSKWTTSNLFYSTSAIGFLNYNNGVGGDYHLLPSSPAIGAAHDGTDLGANVNAVLSTIAGVR
ncbi:MAG TPA: putative Ig domain-containing protein [Candidatus Sulfotelmatobacter sp.]|nr:putative Ig domain-containing protein [Candidatus Sulfotelmatobacter sp.]